MSIFKRKTNNIRASKRQPVRGDSSNRRSASSSSVEKKYAYRRNQTFTGSTSHAVASSNESRSDFKSPRVQVHEMRRKRRYVFSVLLVVLLVCAGLWALMTQMMASISVSIVRSDTHVVSKDNQQIYVQAINKYFDKQPTQRLAFFLDKGSLLDFVSSQQPEVQSIDINDLAGFGKVNFEIVPRKPLAVWSIEGEDRYVDEKGVGFSLNYYDEPEVTITDESGLPTNNKTIASNRLLSFIGKVIGYTKQQGYKVSNVSLPLHTTRQIEVTVQGVAHPTKMTADRSAGEQAEDMIRVFRHASNKQLNLEYVDVRVSGRAYYRDK